MNDAQNYVEEDEPSPAPTLVRMTDEINNNKHDAALGRCLEESMIISR